MLREEGIDAVRYILWDATIPRPRGVTGLRGTEAHWLRDGREDREDPLHVLQEAHSQHVEETTETLGEGPEGFYE